jgi:hypothetical protein
MTTFHETGSPLVHELFHKEATQQVTSGSYSHAKNNPGIRQEARRAAAAKSGKAAAASTMDDARLEL